VSYAELESGRPERRALEGATFGLALAGVAGPDWFFRQLEQAGATVGRCLAFPDHRRYGRDDLRRIRRECQDAPVLMTLKDAVKLGPALGGDVDVQVALQEVEWEAGADEIDRLLSRAVTRREPTLRTT
jgi:tetraacyldisaccharide-1-P 4'-kinase